MSTFQYQTRGSSDQCSLKGRNAVNESIFDYSMSSFRSGAIHKDEKFTQFVLDNLNLRFTDGYGVHSDLVQGDSDLRNRAELTHDRERQQMNTRTFLAVPNLSKGEPVPVLEHVLKSGELTSDRNGHVRDIAYQPLPLNRDIEQMINSSNRALNVWDDRSIGESSKVILNRMRNGQK